jgi:DNA-binding NtrC family response regulator
MSAPVGESSDRPLILLVDDEPAVRLMMARTLTNRGYDVRTAPDGESAMIILEGLRTLPAIAITDLQMAGVDGEELARSLARRYPEVPVIFMTGHLPRYRAAYLPGPILQKPFAAEQLCELVGSLLKANGAQAPQDGTTRLATDDPAIEAGMRI